MLIKLTSEAKKPNISLTVPSIIVVALDLNVLLTIETHLLSVSKPGDHYYISSIQKRNWRGLPTKEIKLRSPALGLNQKLILRTSNLKLVQGKFYKVNIG